jgi:hypothetical protein
MPQRQNFTETQRMSALQHNALWLSRHRVTGVYIATAYENLQNSGLIYYCENCLFCHTDRQFFDVDHLVPDKKFRIWGNHTEARDPVNMMILCKSRQRGDLGCNQCKGARLFVPKNRGLAFTHSGVDMNCFPVRERPFDWTQDPAS